MELKTLKDIAGFRIGVLSDKNYAHTYERKCMLDEVTWIDKKLKEEAIKWVNFLDERMGLKELLIERLREERIAGSRAEHTELYKKYVAQKIIRELEEKAAQIKWIKQFFNITEEELK
jgi:hypothetical protein